MSNDLDHFTTTLTEFIHSGFDEDPTLEYKDIVLNITSVNDHSLDDIDPGDIVEESYEGAMEIQYLIELSNSVHRRYILDDQGFNRTAFQMIVSDNLNAYFVPGMFISIRSVIF